MKTQYHNASRLLARLLLLSGLLIGLVSWTGMYETHLAHAAPLNTVTITDCSNDTQLQSAISSASSGDTINFSCSGTIPLSKTLTIATSLTLDGSGQNVTLDGGNNVQVIYVNKGVSFTLNALTIAHGYADPSNGGGLYNNGGTVSISNSTFTGNAGGDAGGGIDNESGTVSVTNCTFINNSAPQGGGIYNFGGATANVTNSTFSNNSSAASGAGLFNSGTATINNSTFANNSSDGGAGIANSGTISISNSIFASNSATYNGAGLYNFGTATVSSSTFASNTAIGGGGIYNECVATTTISNSTFTSNSASDGAGLYNFYGTLNISNSTIASNSSTGSNSRLIPSCSLPGKNKHQSLKNSISGGGLYNIGGTTSIGGSIVANNTGGNCTGGVSSQGYNLESSTDCSFTASTDQQNTDPKLASALANNGGPTQTLALLDGSPAINKIPASACTVTMDQRGISRPQGPACDIGAFEFRVPALNLPATITVNATGSQGAIVTYTVTGNEPDDASATPTIGCIPASGSTFPIGTTTVNCTASDGASPPDVTTGSFKVIVVANPATQISNLITIVNGFHFKKVIQVSLDTELQVALTAVKQGKIKVACASLNLFIGEVKVLTGHGITSSQAGQLIAAAQQIEAILGC